MVKVTLAAIICLLPAWIASGEVFLVPILPYGPNNQIQALKEVAALAAARNYTLVAHGLLPHYLETETNREVRSVPREQWKVEAAGRNVLPFDLVFDRASFAPLVRVISHEEAVKIHGWDGRLEKVLQFCELPVIQDDLMYLYNERLIDALEAEYVMINKFKCSDRDLANVDRLIGSLRFVGILTFAGALTNGVFNEGLDKAKAWTPCSRAALQVTMQMRMSKSTADAAHAFIQRKVPVQPLHPGVSGRGMPPFIALHVRPWPDSCLDYWIHEEGPLDNQMLASACVDRQTRKKWGTADLMPKMVNALLGVVSEAPFRELLDRNSAYIFVMCHPKIRRKVASELRRHLVAVMEGRAIEGRSAWWTWLLPWWKRPPRISPEAAPALLKALFGSGEEPNQRFLFFLNEADLPAAFRERPTGINTLLGLTEQQVCRDAHTFIGTDVSSMTRNIMQERSALQRLDQTGEREGFRMTAWS